MLHDVAIAGAGPVGATLALALADSGLDVIALDARGAGEQPKGERSIALSHGSRLILERLGVWCALCASGRDVTPITAIDISQAGGFGMTRLSADEQGLSALGYVVSYRALQSVLDREIARRGVPVRFSSRVQSVGATSAYAALALAGQDDVVTSRLAVVADGSGMAIDSARRYRRDYGQVALVARLALGAPHRGVAVERFTAEGPVALLPEGEHYGLVWTTTPEKARELCELPQAQFIEALRSHCGARASTVVGVTERRTFALVLDYAFAAAATRCIAIGNAAQTLHPVAGQGFNLGLRDAHELSRVLIDTPPEAIGSRAMLDRYGRGRRVDRIAGVAFTHGLLGIFGSDFAPLRWSRGLALTLLDSIPPVKRVFTRLMLHGAR